ncbi:hypothetical protein DICVIV_06389, partial [Dictyocaulus viviparus]
DDFVGHRRYSIRQINSASEQGSVKNITIELNEATSILDLIGSVRQSTISAHHDKLVRVLNCSLRLM